MWTAGRHGPMSQEQDDNTEPEIHESAALVRHRPET